MHRYKPLVDKLYFTIAIISFIVIAPLTAMVFFFPSILVYFIIFSVDLLVIYALVSPLFGYVELREETLFIKYGFILKKEIPYSKIRGAEKGRKWYSESIASLKNALPHVNIKYNSFDVTTVSVIDNDGFINELLVKIKSK